MQTAKSVMQRDLPGVTQVRISLCRVSLFFLRAPLAVFDVRLCPFQELETRSLGKSLFLRRERGVWEQLRRQKGLLADAQELLSVRSAEVEDLRLRCVDLKAEVADTMEQPAPTLGEESSALMRV